MSDYGNFRRHAWAAPFEVGMMLGAIVTFTQQNWKYVLISLFTFTISFAPLLYERLFKIRLPASFQFTWVAFVFFSMFSGEVLRFYANVWGWDAGIHFLSGILIGLGMILWLRRLLQKEQAVQMPVWLQFVFVLATSMLVAVFWEIAEFVSDQVFGTNSQDSLVDTMYDLILGLAGTGVLLLGYLRHGKGRTVPGLARAIRQFDPLNPTKE